MASNCLPTVVTVCRQYTTVYKATRYGDGPSLEDDPPRRRHVIVLPRMVHPPKLEGIEVWS
ncbi:hypothetical protein Hanom_Chr09g00816481 [Helianthus anomalus]